MDTRFSMDGRDAWFFWSSTPSTDIRAVRVVVVGASDLCGVWSPCPSVRTTPSLGPGEPESASDRRTQTPKDTFPAAAA
ncbi:Uncharacterised protein [Mycobacteroides abscessus subsp. abscessus]|uniref:Uncharacterized protein n=1 Tax=Gordonia aichiensis NBRC 108223 TaxID=1220583 RepID=L7KQY6_9ACTN|nr:hypothetical protein GOACH_33_00370 [Gordonia aichiensis NBRC 108223]SKY39531.1 Uncharacterised protein [Mycobacteroides abscessus subsp. abscessus]